jgi:hypothetical protein
LANSEIWPTRTLQSFFNADILHRKWPFAMLQRFFFTLTLIMCENKLECLPVVGIYQARLIFQARLLHLQWCNVIKSPRNCVSCLKKYKKKRSSLLCSLGSDEKKLKELTQSYKTFFSYLICAQICGNPSYFNWDFGNTGWNVLFRWVQVTDTSSTHLLPDVRSIWISRKDSPWRHRLDKTGSSVVTIKFVWERFYDRWVSSLKRSYQVQGQLTEREE